MTGTLGFVIPVYQTDGAYIDECLASVRSQSVACPIVVVDDGSTDAGTLAALKRWAERGVRVIRHPENRGVSAAMNTGIEALETEYVMPVGSDDRILPGLAAEVVRVLDSDPGIGVVSIDLRFFGRLEAVQRLPEVDGVVDLLFGNVIPGASAFRKEDWAALGGFDTDIPFGEDWEFWVRLLAAGRRAAVVHQPLYEYRRHRGQVTARTSPEDRIARDLDVVRRNAGIWGAHVEEIMARYWRVRAERDQHAARLDVLERRFGGLNRLLGRAARMLRRLRPGRRS
ncbi:MULTISPECIES: glycosyltransferase [Microbacterium]|uniref:glycosyltransferase n=1 Tax=Microbacterium TaxID=33882 RepID=UPI00217EA072|nr:MULTISPECIES: glycosyltransferase [Microbacterium]UWF77889.1 glycosyltransferase [Microbacterium neungamense]WCM56066.1 glycosyltransferase [Microbacterium sp. EF45047]